VSASGAQRGVGRLGHLLGGVEVGFAHGEGDEAGLGLRLLGPTGRGRDPGHGVGRATIWSAICAARRERVNPIFVECEDKEWEKSVYRRLGFDEAGKVHRFIRPWGDPASGRFSFAY